MTSTLPAQQSTTSRRVQVKKVTIYVPSKPLLKPYRANS